MTANLTDAAVIHLAAIHLIEATAAKTQNT
jgi:hypothetical protein